MDKLGIEPSLLLAQVVNFTILLIVLNKLLYKPILEMLEKRRKNIEESLALTEKLKLEDEKNNEKREKIIEAAEKDGQTLIEDARKHGKEEEKDIVSEARIEGAEIIEKARIEAERIKKDMEKSMREEAIGLATAMSRRLLTGILGTDEQHKVIREHLKDLKDVRS